MYSLVLTKLPATITPTRHLKNAGNLCNLFFLSTENISVFNSDKQLLSNEIMYFDVLSLKAAIFFVEDRLSALLLVKKEKRSLFKQLTAELALLKFLLKRAKRVSNTVFTGSKPTYYDPSKNIVYLQSCDRDILKRWLEEKSSFFGFENLSNISRNRGIP